MPLNEDQIAAVLFAGRVPEMVEADVVEGGRGSEAGDMSAELAGLPVRLHHHGKGVPANERADAPLDGRITRGMLFARFGDRVQVSRVGGIRQVCPRAPGLVDKHLQQEVRPFDAVTLNDRVERLDPLLGFFAIDFGYSG